MNYRITETAIHPHLRARMSQRGISLEEIQKVMDEGMKIEYDAVRDLLYIWFTPPGKKASRTETVTPGVHADFDRQGRLVGIEVLDASEILQQKVQFEVALTPAYPETVAA